MSELYEKIVNQRGSFERLVTRIPGFAGYIDNKTRRTADRLIREHIADLLSSRIARLVEVEKVILDKGGLNLMSKTSSAKLKLRHFCDRINAAAPAYSGFFEEIKVTPADMDKIYSFDEAMLRYCDQFDAALDKLTAAANEQSGIDAAIAELDSLTIEANSAFSLRDDVLTNLGKPA